MKRVCVSQDCLGLSLTARLCSPAITLFASLRRRPAVMRGLSAIATFVTVSFALGTRADFERSSGAGHISVARASGSGSSAVSRSTASAAPSSAPSGSCEPRYVNKHSHVDTWKGAWARGRCSAELAGLPRPKSFVRRQGTRLVLDGKPFIPVGVNAYCPSLDRCVDADG